MSVEVRMRDGGDGIEVIYKKHMRFEVHLGMEQVKC